MDIIGAITGIVAGSALSPFNEKARAQYIVQGGLGGAGRVFQTINSGVGGVIGYSSLGKEGIKIGIEKGVAGVPEMMVKSAFGWTEIFLIGALILGIGLIGGGE